MRIYWSKFLFYVGAFTACSIISVNVGCASGGFKTTRQFAGLINGQHPTLLRVVLYILTLVVFAITMLLDTLIFNTMDFWDGKVSAGSYNFKDGDKTYFAHHEYLPGSNLRRSTIEIRDEKQGLLQEINLNELASGEIEMLVDGKLRARVSNIHELPLVSTYDAQGNLEGQKTLWPTLVALGSKAAVY